MTTFNLRNGLRLLGIAALIVGGFTAAILYFSFGTTFAERAVYVFIGVIFAAAGGLLLPSAVELWREEKAGPSAGVFLFWLLAILPLGLSGHAGFFSVAQSELAAQSIPVQAERARLERIDAGLSAATQYAAADLGALTAAADSAKSAVDSARQTLDACPPNYKTKCINPARQQLDAAQDAYRVAAAELRNAQQYHGLLAERENALSSLASASSGVGAVTGVHPLFDLLGSLFEVSPATARAVFLSWSAVALELVAAFAFIIAGSLGRAEISEAHPSAYSGTSRRQPVGFVAQAQPIQDPPANSFHDSPMPEIQGLGFAGFVPPGYSAKPDATVNHATVNTQNTHWTQGICQQCGQPYDRKVKWQKFCSESCRIQASGFASKADMLKAKRRKSA
jgi:hypothetical protein